MTEKELETAAEEEELLAPSVSDVSDISDVAETSTPDGLTEERLLELLAANNQKLLDEINSGVVEEVAERAAQGWKDRRLGKFETQIDELLSIREQVDRDGGDWTGVLADFQAREREEQIYQNLMNRVSRDISARRPASDERSAWVQEWQAAIQRTKDKLDGAGVKYDPAELDALTKGAYGSATEARDALADYQVAKLTGAVTSEVSTSAVSIEGGGEAPPTSEGEKSTEDSFAEAQNKLAKAVAQSGAGSNAAKQAQAEIDALVAKQMSDYFGE